ncbi:MAG: AAA family ATPase [Clostridia bacterium]|nr:AAA family ATPase [Clostridia bacterium]
MRLIELSIRAFGGLRDRRLRFSPGLNLLYGANEQGKSTVMACIQALLYGFNGRAHNIRDNGRRRYMPWDGDRMEASLTFSHDGVRYRLERVFAERRTGDTLVLMDDATGREIPLPSGTEPGEALLGVSGAEFAQTVFVGQLAVQIRDPDDSILAKLANLATTGEEAVSFSEVDERLRRAQVRLRPERGRGGRIAQLADLRTELEERLENALRAESEQADRLARMERLDGEIARAESDAAVLRARVETIGALEAQASAARAARDAAERAEQTLLDGMAAWEREWEQEERLREEAEAESAGRLARLAEEQASRERDRKRMEAEARDETAVPIRFWIGSLPRLAIAAAVLLLAGGLLAGDMIRPSLSWIAAGALVPVAVLATAAAGHRKVCAADKAARLERAREREAAAGRLEAAVREYGRARDQAAADRIRRQSRADELERRREGIEADIRAQAGAAPAARAAWEAAERHLADASGGMPPGEVRDREREGQTVLAALREERAGIGSAVRHAPRDPEGVDVLTARLTRTGRRIREAEERHAALVLARQAYREAYDALQTDFAPRVGARAAEILAAFTGGRYTGFKTDNRFDVRVADASGASYRSWEYLSGGAVDQAYLALRLAVAESVGQGDGLPLLLDDVFVQFDDDRALAGLRMLRAWPGQTLLFYSHRRLTDAADTEGWTDARIGL